MAYKRKTAQDYYAETDDLGNWNSAGHYAQINIVEPIAQIKEYEKIARYGYTSIYSELSNLNNLNNDLMKLKGFERLVNTMITLCDNVEFAMKRGETRKKLKSIRANLKKIRAAMHLFYHQEQLNNSQVIRLNSKYYLALEKMAELKVDLYHQLNRNNLLFQDKEMFNPTDYKKKIIEHVTTHG